MNTRISSYQTIDLSMARRVMIGFIDLFSWGHSMFGLLEVDVTCARRYMDSYKARTGERLSFTGYLAYCLAQAIDGDKSVQAYLKGRNKLVLFDDVDIGLMVEHQEGEARTAVGHVIRRANHKTFMEIHREIRTIQSGPVPRRKDIPPWLKLLACLPGPLVKLIRAIIRIAIERDPANTWVANAGTVGITSVGMFGRGSGWGLAPADGHSLSLIVGGISRKPVVIEDQIEPRDMLCLTVIFDHHVIDGAPATRFTRRLVALIESGYGLEGEPLATPIADLVTEVGHYQTMQV